ncbi:hypothetical protein PTSG_03501 [Salpingoeca rosetta]|uniref:Folliculin n=1 Tax=Salpingoeca rosetta (strain ATCC 50818 / BSB-021) TaxID=946362 RepID=F2U5S9_SALR5|nr:uncharacterized protein PTSG_03501 [Salpingoeca rosetta]EGD82870.1 hypothetical protein PTSG_03501 [Salpingoeca rosetta]|eukprot:XP_004995234.1 hypothetical protein PTSG_03501 [Salpingoeca rosetta]
MNSIAALCHFCELHGPQILLTTTTHHLASTDPADFVQQHLVEQRQQKRRQQRQQAQHHQHGMNGDAAEQCMRGRTSSSGSMTLAEAMFARNRGASFSVTSINNVEDNDDDADAYVGGVNVVNDDGDGDWSADAGQSLTGRPLTELPARTRPFYSAPTSPQQRRRAGCGTRANRRGPSNSTALQSKLQSMSPSFAHRSPGRRSGSRGSPAASNAELTELTEPCTPLRPTLVGLDDGPPVRGRIRPAHRTRRRRHQRTGALPSSASTSPPPVPRLTFDLDLGSDTHLNGIVDGSSAKRGDHGNPRGATEAGGGGQDGRAHQYDSVALLSRQTSASTREAASPRYGSAPSSRPSSAQAHHRPGHCRRSSIASTPTASCGEEQRNGRSRRGTTSRDGPSTNNTSGDGNTTNHHNGSYNYSSNDSNHRNTRNANSDDKNNYDADAGEHATRSNTSINGGAFGVSTLYAGHVDCPACGWPCEEPGFVSFDEENSTLYLSEHRPLRSEVYDPLRRACLRAFSSEVTKGGPVLFGDSQQGFTFSHVFEVKDVSARGGHRRYGILVLVADKLYLASSWSFLRQHVSVLVRDIVRRAEAASVNLPHSSHLVAGALTSCRRNLPFDRFKSLRDTSDFLSLIQLLESPLLYSDIHAYLTWVLKGFHARLVERPLEGGSLVGSAPTSFDDMPAASLSDLCNVLGTDSMRLALHHISIGNQCIVLASQPSVSTAIAQLLACTLPDRCVSLNVNQREYVPTYACNILGMSGAGSLPDDLASKGAVLLRIHTAVEAMTDGADGADADVDEDWPFYAPIKRVDVEGSPGPDGHVNTFVTAVLEASERPHDPELSVELLRALREKYTRIAKMYFALTRGKKVPPYRALQVLGLPPQDQQLLMFWTSALSPTQRRVILQETMKERTSSE